MNADEAMNHRVYSWSDTDDIRAILALQAEVRRLRDERRNLAGEVVGIAKSASDDDEPDFGLIFRAADAYRKVGVGLILSDKETFALVDEVRRLRGEP